MTDERDRSVREWAIMYLQFTIEDLARTKRRQFEITYYGALLEAAAVLVAKAFEDAKVATCPLLAILLIISPLIAALNVYLIIQGVISIHEFRLKLDHVAQKFWPEEIMAIPPRGGRSRLSERKYVQDVWLNVFLLIMPVGGTIFACWYLLALAIRACPVNL